MSDLYDDFEKRFKNAWFSVGWQETSDNQMKGEVQQQSRRTLASLQAELNDLQDDMEKICAKQLMLENLSKLYKAEI